MSKDGEMRSLNLESRILSDLSLSCCTVHCIGIAAAIWTIKNYNIVDSEKVVIASATVCKMCRCDIDWQCLNSNQWYRCHLPIGVHPFLSSPSPLHFINQKPWQWWSWSQRWRWRSKWSVSGDMGSAACCLLPSLQILTRDGFCF